MVPRARKAMPLTRVVDELEGEYKANKPERVLDEKPTENSLQRRERCALETLHLVSKSFFSMYRIYLAAHAEIFLLRGDMNKNNIKFIIYVFMIMIYEKDLSKNI
ncbi:hypothetical protein V1478_018341 [Vespula squamosa]|uniref:Uncharacterized protein n=1 Tax=Vespula squamosa TaxID=30214 RepID=A0ABD1ZUR8_VESSQ